MHSSIPRFEAWRYRSAWVYRSAVRAIRRICTARGRAALQRIPSNDVSTLATAARRGGSTDLGLRTILRARHRVALGLPRHTSAPVLSRPNGCDSGRPSWVKVGVEIGVKNRMPRDGRTNGSRCELYAPRPASYAIRMEPTSVSVTTPTTWVP